MNTGLTINTAANTIEMTKEFARKARYFGTDEYKLLQDARKDYPTFSVATRKTVSKESYKGLTINYMYNYIKKHPQSLTLEDGTIMTKLTVFPSGKKCSLSSAIQATSRKLLHLFNVSWILQNFICGFPLKIINL